MTPTCMLYITLFLNLEGFLIIDLFRKSMYLKSNHFFSLTSAPFSLCWAVLSRPVVSDSATPSGFFTIWVTREATFFLYCI